MFAPARAILAALFLAAPAFAQDYVTVDWVNLRQKPAMNGAKLKTLAPGETLTVRTVKPRTGWVAVRTTDSDSTAGWVGEAHLQALHAGDTSVTVAHNPPAGSPTVPATTPTTIASGAAAAHIDPSWAKPSIVQTTIPMKNGTVQCGPTGDGVDDGTNLHKNRADVPATSHFISLDAIRSLNDTAFWGFTNRKNPAWPALAATHIDPYEGTPVTVEGYFEIVKPQSGGSGESPNCHGSDELDTDWHVAFVANPGETEEQAVVVEPTPRSKRANPLWSPDAAKLLAIRHSPSDTRHEAQAPRMRVTGFLMFDPVHPSHIRGNCKANCASKNFFRATLWEIHPVTKIEVQKNGAWVDLNGPPPA